MRGESDTSLSASPADDAGPRTAAQIRSRLDLDHSLLVERHGVRYHIGEDEDGNGFHAWTIPVGETDAAVASFGECDMSGVPEDWSLDYTALSERIAEWLATPPSSPAGGPVPCPRCGGTGTMVDADFRQWGCDHCNGGGWILTSGATPVAGQL